MGSRRGILVSRQLMRFWSYTPTSQARKKTELCGRHGDSATASVTSSCQPAACRLDHRALVEVVGEEGRAYLQGFVTADMAQEREEAFYSMMLNAEGRVLYDVLLYPQLNNSYYLECDSSQRNNLMLHLRKYSLRTKVKFSLLDDHQVWALFPWQQTGLAAEATTSSTTGYILFPDPRVRSFGWRLLLPSELTPTSLWPNIKIVDSSVYRRHRLLSGIPEGADEIVSGRSLPLECNLDFMNGVSFNKGCYLGQELTARTHHTGTTRKRIMPFTMSEEGSTTTIVASGSSISSATGKKSVGKVLSCHGDHGLALIRLSELDKGDLTVKDEGGSEEVCLIVHIPDYWPT